MKSTFSSIQDIWARGNGIIFLIILFPLFLCLSSAPLMALPTGEQVEAGEAAFERPDSSTLNITTSDKVVINWNSFDIASHETVNFLQPSVTSSALNRVLGGGSTSIAGTLNANGTIVLVNPNGIAISETAHINVGNLIAASLNINTSDFLAGNYHFLKDADLPAGVIINRGSIEVARGGLAALFGDQVSNEGKIIAEQGSIVLASGEEIVLNFGPASTVSVVIPKGVNLDPLNGTSGDAITNKGELFAAGGKVILTASQLNRIFDSLINMEGIIKANSAVELADGTIELVAINGNIKSTGTYEAATVNMDADEIELGGLVNADFSYQTQNGSLTDLGYEVTGTISSVQYLTALSALYPISGTIYLDEGDTPIGSGVTVSAAVEGTATGITTTTAADGTYTLSGVTLAGGEVVAVYLSGGTVDGVTIVTGFSQPDLDQNMGLSGIDIYAGYLILNHLSNGKITNGVIAQSNSSGIPDINSIFEVSSIFPSVNIAIQDNKKLLVLPGTTYEPDGSLYTGTLIIQGTVNGGGNLFNILGSSSIFSNNDGPAYLRIDSGGVFNAQLSTINMNQFGQVTIEINGGILDLENGSLDLSSFQFNPSSFLISGGIFNALNGNVNMNNVSYTQTGGTVTGGSGNWNLSSFTLSGGIFNQGAININDASSSFLQIRITNGAVFNGGSGSISATDLELIDSTYNGEFGSLLLGVGGLPALLKIDNSIFNVNNMTINMGFGGDARFELISGEVNLGGVGSIHLGGGGSTFYNQFGGVFNGGTGGLFLDGGGNGHFNLMGGDFYLGRDLSMGGGGPQTINISGGNFYQQTGDISIGGGGNTSFQVTGGNFYGGTGSVRLLAGSFSSEFLMESGLFYAGSGFHEYGEFTQTGGLYDGQSAQITVNRSLNLFGGSFVSTSEILSIEGNFINQGGDFDHNFGTVNFTGSNTHLIVGSNTFYNLTVNGSGVGDPEPPPSDILTFEEWLDSDLADDLNQDGVIDKLDYEIYVEQEQGGNGPPPMDPYQDWLMSPEAGDYDGDGQITEIDYQIWIDQQNPPPPDLLTFEEWIVSPEAKDLNGDMLVDEQDYQIYVDQQGGTEPPPMDPFQDWLNSPDAGDYDQNGVIDEQDYQIYLDLQQPPQGEVLTFEEWLMSPEAKDLNGDLLVDEQDYQIFVDQQAGTQPPLPQTDPYQDWLNSPEAQDLDGDGQVTEIDYQIFLDQQGGMEQPPTGILTFEEWLMSPEAKDFDGDMDINEIDYQIWLDMQNPPPPPPDGGGGNGENETTVIFEAGSTQTILGTLTIQGVKLRSSEEGTQWYIFPQGDINVSNVDVQDSVNLSLIIINPPDSVDSGNNVRWFASSGISISGIIYSEDGEPSGLTVKLLVNGEPYNFTATSLSDGSYTFTNVSLSDDDMLAVYLSGSSLTGTSITRVLDSSLDITGLDIYAGTANVQNNDTSSSLSIADIYQAVGNSADSDILVTSDGINMNVDGNLILNGSLDMGEGTVTIGGGLDASNGSFTTDGTVVFTSQEDESITSNGSEFNEAVFEGGNWTATDDLVFNGSVTTNNSMILTAGENNLTFNSSLASAGESLTLQAENIYLNNDFPTVGAGDLIIRADYNEDGMGSLDMTHSFTAGRDLLLQTSDDISTSQLNADYGRNLTLISTAGSIYADTSMSAPNGSITLDGYGTVYVDSITAADELLITSETGGIFELVQDDAVDLTANHAVLTAASGIGTSEKCLEVDFVSASFTVTGTGDLNICDLSGGLYVMDASTANGAITFDVTGGDLITGMINAGNNDVTLNSDGAILDDGDNGTWITGNNLYLTAGTSIGESGNAVDTNAELLYLNSTSGIYVTDMNSVTVIEANTGYNATIDIGAVTDLIILESGLSTTGPEGDLILRADIDEDGIGELIILGHISSEGNLLLQTGPDLYVSNYDFSVAGALTLISTSGDVIFDIDYEGSGDVHLFSGSCIIILNRLMVTGTGGYIELVSEQCIENYGLIQTSGMGGTIDMTAGTHILNMGSIRAAGMGGAMYWSAGSYIDNQGEIMVAGSDGTISLSAGTSLANAGLIKVAGSDGEIILDANEYLLEDGTLMATGKDSTVTIA